MRNFLKSFTTAGQIVQILLWMNFLKGAPYHNPYPGFVMELLPMLDSDNCNNFVGQLAK